MNTASEQPSPRGKEAKGGGAARMRQRFNELVDDAFTLFGSASSGSQGRTLDDGPPGGGSGELRTVMLTTLPIL